MPVSIVRRKLRIPIEDKQNPDLISTGWVDALVYGGLIAVHPTTAKDNRWAITMAVSGEMLFHVETEAEAQDFTLKLLVEADRRGLPLNFDRYLSCPPAVKEFLIGFCSGWRGQNLRYVIRKPGEQPGQGVLFAPDGRRIV